MKFFVGQTVSIKQGVYKNRLGHIREKIKYGKNTYFIVELWKYACFSGGGKKEYPKVIRCFNYYELDLEKINPMMDQLKLAIFKTELKTFLANREKEKRHKLIISEIAGIWMTNLPEFHRMRSINIIVDSNLKGLDYRLEVIE